MKCTSIEIRSLSPVHAASLASFFELLQARGVSEFFHPHPLTADAAQERATYIGKDLYFVLLEGERVLAYGMLRGWDHGYKIPSLGIAVHPDEQGKGLGRLLIRFMCVAASRCGAKKVRLRVDRENTIAVRLYRSLGFKFVKETDGMNLVGILDLSGIK